MYVSGRGPPGTKVNLYLNDAYIASATASAEGRVAFAIRSGIKPGDYRVRLDQVDDSGRVQKRAEVPFTAPVTVAAASPATPAPGSGDTSNKLAATSASPERTPAPPPAAARGAEPDSSPATAAAPPEPPAPQIPPRPRDTASTSTGQPPSSSLEAAAPPVSPTPAAAQTASVPRETARTQSEAPPSSPSPATSEPASHQQAAKDATPPPARGPTITATATPKPAATQDAGTNVVVIPRVDTTLVNRGDSLWRISKTTYGRGVRYSVIYNANRDQIRDPDLIYPGQIFVLPKDKQ
jgi:nucleoid-associated protein YgaU